MNAGSGPDCPGRSWLPRRILVHVPRRSREYADQLTASLAAHPPGPPECRPPRPVPEVRAVDGPDEAASLAAWPDTFFGAGLEPSLLLEMPALRWIQWVWAGVDRLTLDGPFREALISGRWRLTRAVGMFGPGMAEYVLAQCLAHAWKLPAALQAQRERVWRRYEPALVRGRRLGVAGLGSTGIEVARLAQAVGMEVSGLTRSRRPAAPVRQVYPVTAMGEFLARLDYLVVTLPLTAETRGLFGAEALAAMKPGSVLINIGRGPVVDQAALIAALGEGRPGYAVLDVLSEEPPPADSPLWSLPNVIITPHIAGLSRPEDMVPLFLDNLDRLRAGQALRGEVDPRLGY